MNDGEYEEIVAYNDILEHITRDNEDDQPFWRFKRIIAHQGPLQPSHPDYMGSRYNVLVEWENGETTTEPLVIFAKDAPVACALYAKENALLDTEGWKIFKPIAKREKKLFCMVNQAKLRSFRTAKVYKYGYEVPCNHDDAMRLDAMHKNSKWLDAEALELAQLDEYHTFKDIG